jgi:hypothetical protein
MEAGTAGLLSLWRAIKTTAEWHPEYGIEKAWSQHVYEWGPPLEIRETTMQYNGQSVRGRTFLNVGVVIWDETQGTVVIGWVPLPQ